MHTSRPAVTAPPSPLRLAVVFLILFAAYQAPEGIGMRLLGSMPVLAALMLAFLPIAWACGRVLGFRGLDAWFMGFSRGWFGLLAATFVLAVAVKAIALMLGSQAGVYAVSALEGLSASAVLLAALAMLPYTFFPSVAEDILTRGFLMRAFPRLSQQWLFVVFSAGLYVLNHIYRLGNGAMEWIMLFCFGLAYGAALYYSRSLWAAIGLHWGWNFTGQFADRVVAVETVAPGAGPVVSSLAHVFMLVVVVVAARRFAAEPDGMPGRA